MWLFTDKGFLSIVTNLDNENELLVRGRFKGDIEAHFPGAEVEENTGTDYKYRTYLPRDMVTARLSRYVDEELIYPNYKNSVRDMNRLDVYSDVWVVMRSAQEKNPT
jgi:hypothetical protein